MVQFGNGFTVMDIYNMPTRLRMFYYQKLVEVKKKEADEMQKTTKAAQASKVRVKR
jgi:hypothetical protein